ncbi:MAG: type II toxin-antitoxin system HicA family toxin [Methanothrix sp.]|nr:type II toxin-antitoxin system HicA family toxin [Methanothrix sp.]
MLKSPSSCRIYIFQLLAIQSSPLNTAPSRSFVRQPHYIFANAETKRRVTVPFHSQDVARGTLLQILKDAGISREELQDLL